MNPYWGVQFFSFFATLIQRILGGGSSLAPDEVQLIVLSAVGISCGVIGPLLVLRKMTLFANSLSHTILVGIAGAYIFTSSFLGAAMFDLSTLCIGALVAAMLTAVLTDWLVRFFRLQEDASIGLVFTGLFALGIALVTLYTRDLHLGIEAVMGNVDVLQFGDAKIALLLAFVNVFFVTFFYRQFQIVSFDRNLAKVLGVRYGLFHFLILFLTALTCVAAFRAVGVILVIAFLVGPYLTARLFCQRLPWLLFWSPVVAIAASMVGVALSRHVLTVSGMPLSTGGVVVVLIGIFYLMGLVLKRIRLTGNLRDI